MKPLILNKTKISFPYLNANTKTDAVNQLLVDVEEGLRSYTVSLKYAYSQYYNAYETYLQQHNNTTLQQKISLYYNTIIKTKIAYKYKIGQFGFLVNENNNTVEDLFVCIMNTYAYDREVSFLHPHLKKYEYCHYDITSSKPKVLGSGNNGWISESEFIPIAGTMDGLLDSGSKHIIQLLNWKTCREDYLIKKLNEEKINTKEQRLALHAMDVTSTDDTVTEYVTDTDNEYNINIVHVRDTDTETDCVDTNKSIVQYGYTKQKHLCYTLFGEIFTAFNQSNMNAASSIINTEQQQSQQQHDEKKEYPVAIKKLYNNNNSISNVVIDSNLIKEALILRRMETKNTLVNNSIVNYTDFFQGHKNRDYYLVMEYNFNITLKEFVDRSHEYIAKGKLNLTEYQETIKYLLWRLAATINWLHKENYVTRCDLDICPENVLLSKADFIQNDSDKSVAINLMIEMKMVDFGIRELLNISNYHKLKEFSSKYSNKYLSREFYERNENNYNEYDLCADDMWSVGIVFYYCFFGRYPSASQIYNNNNQLNGYIKSQGLLKFVDQKMLSLLNGLLDLDQTKRLKSIQLLKHPWFYNFYKAYLSLTATNYLNHQ